MPEPGKPPLPDDEHDDVQEPSDDVQEASEESFPASDAPSWGGGGAVPEVEEEEGK